MKKSTLKVYTLHTLPSHTDPMWILSQLKGITDASVMIRVDGLDQRKVKKMAERARRQNLDVDHMPNMDSAVSFEESSEILEGLIRGTEEVVRLSLVITSKNDLNLDPAYFCAEKNPELALFAITGRRVRMHRPHYVRVKTATDITPSLFDSKGSGNPLLKTRRGFPLYFSPLDERLEAKHWLVVGATGSGKSFFTGLLLKRLLNEEISVLFIDHNRSFKRICEQAGVFYLEPSSLAEVKRFCPWALDKPRIFAGVELSDLLLDEKKEASRILLEKIEAFLRARSTSHTVYVVLDECWNFLRDEPVLVQRAYREYRKLGAAMVSLSQSLTDFLLTQNGQSILQNAPIRILLRQGEDLGPLKGTLGLNEVEMLEARRLRQKKREFSECLIKTPFSSHIARLHPTPDEYELFRTDNLRNNR